MFKETFTVEYLNSMIFSIGDDYVSWKEKRNTSEILLIVRKNIKEKRKTKLLDQIVVAAAVAVF